MDRKLVYRTNRNIVIAFITTLLLLLIIVDALLLNQQYSKMQAIAKDRATQELQLATDFSYEPALKDDLISVKRFLEKWANNDDILISLHAVTANGFTLVDINKDIKSKNTVTVSKDIIHEDKVLLTASVTEDYSQMSDSIIKNAIILFVISALIVSIVGYLLWIVLRRTAIKPLQLAIDDLIKSEKILEKRSKQLELSNQELESYSYSIAHDLRTPLRSITSFSQILKEDASSKLNKDEIDYLERIYNAGTFMSQLIYDILELSKISREEIKYMPVDLSKAANDILLYLKNLWPNIEFEFEIENNLYVSGDEASLRSLLDNLISNACKFSSKSPSPKIEFGVQNRSVTSPVFYVKDNGAGFDMKYAEKIFVPFHRLHKSTQFDGTGIGLATVKRIAEKHHGKVWVESEENKGATFFFTLGNQNLENYSPKQELEIDCL